MPLQLATNTWKNQQTFLQPIIAPHIGETLGDIILAVSSSGVDSTAPIFSGDHTSTPFLTVQGALSVLPPINKHNIIINVAAGTFSNPFTVPSFIGTGSIRIIGSHTLSTLASGSNSGTCGVGTNLGGAYSVLATIKKPTGAPNWTPGDLRGRFFLITGGTGFQTAPVYAIGCIASNTVDTAIVNYISVAGDVNLFLAAIDNTTQFQIVDLTTIIGGGGIIASQSYVQARGCQNILQFEQLSLNGAGDSSFNIQSNFCLYSVVTACVVHNTLGTNIQGLGFFGGGTGVAQSNRCIGGAGCAAGYEGIGLFYAQGNVTNGTGGPFGARNCVFAAGFGNDCDGSVGGNNMWFVTQCGSFSDYASSIGSTSIAPYYIEGTPNSALGGITVYGAITGYGIYFIGPGFVSNDNKLLTGSLGDFFLDDTLGSYSGMATNDEAVRGSCTLQYTGA